MRPFPISETSPVEHAAPLPGKADAVVIGGGVIGASAALFLARRGQRVVLLEKGRIAGEQSSRNWGWVRVQGRDPAEVPVMLEARRHWQDFVPQLDTDIGLRQTGLLYLAETQDDLARYEGWMPHARAFGLDTRLVAPRDLAELLPGASGRWMGGLWTPSDMRAEPFLAVPALARLAAREGAVVAESCAVRLLDIEAGKVMGVITERGRIRAPAVILAAGAWSSLFLRRHGLSIPQRGRQPPGFPPPPRRRLHPRARQLP
jgi:glycine/D-amino acid oxidase-like deaminating enzyme